MSYGMQFCLWLVNTISTLLALHTDTLDNNKVINELCGSITIQVCSIDRWDRHITRGYGTTSIPCQPG